MDEIGEIVINDLLSFLYCKKDDYPADILLTSAQKFYGKKVISEARNILFKALPNKPSTELAKSVTANNDLLAIYKCLKLIPEEEMPYFVCINLNNVPMMKHSSATGPERLDTEKTQVTPSKESTSQKYNNEPPEITSSAISPLKVEEDEDLWDLSTAGSDSSVGSDNESMNSDILADDCYEIEYCGEEDEVIDLESNHADLLYRQCLSEDPPLVTTNASSEKSPSRNEEYEENGEPVYDPNMQIKEEIDIDFETEDIFASESIPLQPQVQMETEDSTKMDSCMDLRIESVMAGPNTVELSKELDMPKDEVPHLPPPIQEPETPTPILKSQKSFKSHKKPFNAKSKKFKRVLMEQLSDGPLKKEQLSVLQAIYCPLCGFKTNSKHVLLKHMKIHAEMT